ETVTGLVQRGIERLAEIVGVVAGREAHVVAGEVGAEGMRRLVLPSARRVEADSLDYLPGDLLLLLDRETTVHQAVVHRVLARGDSLRQWDELRLHLREHGRDSLWLLA